MTAKTAGSGPSPFPLGAALRAASRLRSAAAALADRAVPGSGADLSALLPRAVGGPGLPPLPRWGQAMRIIEVRTKLVSLSAMLVGSLSGTIARGFVDWTALGLLFFSGLCVDSGTTAFNSWFDSRSGVDDPARNRDADKVILRQGIARGWALAAALALFFLGALSGWSLACIRGWDVLAVGMAGMAVGFLYNGGPRPLSGTPFGELFAGGALGLALTALSDRVAAGAWSARGFLVGLPSFFIVASILSVNNACDAESDAAAGRRTLAILAGPAFMRFLIPFQGVLALASAFMARVLGALPRLAPLPIAMGALAALPSYISMAKRGYLQEMKGPNMGAVSRVLFIQAAALCIALLMNFV